jgi:hypothetical protein
MLELVTKADARAQLRLDDVGSAGGPDDAWLDIFIPAVSEAVRSWLKVDARLYVPLRDSAGDIMRDSAGDPIPQEDSNGPVVNPSVRAAVLIELAYQFRFREGEGEHTATGDLYSGRYGYTLSRGATAILSGIRKSTVA